MDGDALGAKAFLAGYIGPVFVDGRPTDRETRP